MDSKGFIMEELGKPETAIKYYQKAVQVNPEFPVFLYNNGKAHQKLRENREALECFNKALKLDPNYKDAQKAKEEILSKKLKNSNIQCNK